MKILINNKSGQPIYEQIYMQIRDAIVRGELSEHRPLPSIRSLAKDLHISVITTKRAYEDLERDGFIESFTGKGSFVSGQNQELVREEGLRQIEKYLMDAVDKAKQFGISYEELSSLLNMLYKGE